MITAIVMDIVVRRRSSQKHNNYSRKNTTSKCEDNLIMIVKIGSIIVLMFAIAMTIASTSTT